MKLINRPQYINKLIDVRNTPDIKVITGVRRAGKSKLLEAYARYLKEVDPSANIVYIDLTKIRFEALKEYHSLNDYIEAKYVEGSNNYVMIDEVPLCENFELTINSLHSDQKYDIYITGSNAFLLSSDLSTLFTGRHFEIHVYPFSFKEFCVYFDDAENIQQKFDRYILLGGFAGSYSYTNDDDKAKYLRDVYNTILMRDLVEKYHLENPVILRRIGNYLMDNVSNMSSTRNIADALVSNGKETNHKTVGKYIDYLCKAFLFYETKRYDIKGKNYLQFLSKYYFVDTGLRISELGKRNMDWGRMLENIVFIELCRRGYEVYVGKLYQKEIDFVAMRGNEKIYIQVSDDISSDSTFKRETEPLLKIRDVYPKLLLARTRQEEMDYEGIRIMDIPRWLFE